LGASPFQFFYSARIIKKLSHLKKSEGEPGFCHSLFCMQPTATAQKELKQLAQSLVRKKSKNDNKSKALY
jgi:hypothetical protein